MGSEYTVVFESEQTSPNRRCSDPAVLEMFSDLQAEVEDWLDTPVGKVVGDIIMIHMLHV